MQSGWRFVCLSSLPFYFALHSLHTLPFSYVELHLFHFFAFPCFSARRSPSPCPRLKTRRPCVRSAPPGRRRASAARTRFPCSRGMESFFYFFIFQTWFNDNSITWDNFFLLLLLLNSWRCPVTCLEVAAALESPRNELWEEHQPYTKPLSSWLFICFSLQNYHQLFTNEPHWQIYQLFFESGLAAKHIYLQFCSIKES